MNFNVAIRGCWTDSCLIIDPYCEGSEEMDNEEKKEFARLKRRTTKLINKVDDKCLEFTDLEVATISRVGHAETMKDISWLVIKQMERIFDKYKIR